MGAILSRFCKKKTTIEILGNLDKKIKDIEKYGQSTEQRHKKIVGILIIYSVALYIISAIIFYFYFFPSKFYDQLLYITPLLIFPILIFLMKQIVSWYYKRKIFRNQEKLVFLQEEKKKILDEVTETETYKKAKEIFMEFAPDRLNMTPNIKRQSQIANLETQKFSTPLSTTPVLQPTSELRQRKLLTTNLNQSLFNSKVQTTGPALTAPPTLTPMRKNESLLPRPILPQQRSYIDKLVEYVVGDGPNNRYALICRQCESHNGMALKEEFEYFAFRCCYCNFWNPARKQKPAAPKLELDDNLLNLGNKLSLELTKSTKNLVNSEPNDSENVIHLSDTDSDIEVVEKISATPDSEENNLADMESTNFKSEASPITQATSTNDAVNIEKQDIDE